MISIGTVYVQGKSPTSMIVITYHLWTTQSILVDVDGGIVSFVWCLSAWIWIAPVLSQLFLKIKSYKKHVTFDEKGSENNNLQGCMSLRTRRFWLESRALSMILFNILAERVHTSSLLTKKWQPLLLFLGWGSFLLLYFILPHPYICHQIYVIMFC